MEKSSKPMNANTLKIIAIAAMLTDHLAEDYVSKLTLLGQFLHLIGRLTAPIMAFFIVEGFYHTRNCKKYVIRLFIFSIISYFAYQFHNRGEFFYGFRTHNYISVLMNSVIFTLLLGLITLIIWYKTEWKRWLKILGVCLCCVLALTSDWACIGVLWVFFMGIHYGNFKAQMISLAVIGLFFNGSLILGMYFSGMEYWWTNLYQFGVIGAIPVLSLYNGKLGKSKNMKWVFYIFYPLHLMILGWIKFYM